MKKTGTIIVNLGLSEFTIDASMMFFSDLEAFKKEKIVKIPFEYVYVDLYINYRYGNKLILNMSQMHNLYIIAKYYEDKELMNLLDENYYNSKLTIEAKNRIPRYLGYGRDVFLIDGNDNIFPMHQEIFSLYKFSKVDYREINDVAYVSVKRKLNNGIIKKMYNCEKDPADWITLNP